MIIIFFCFSSCFIISRVGWSSLPRSPCIFIHNVFYLFIYVRSFLLSPSFKSLFFLSRSHVVSGRSVELTIVDLIFFPQFFYDFFFQFHHFILNYFPFIIVFFSLFLLLDYSKSGLVKLTQIGLGFFDVFFIEL